MCNPQKLHTGLRLDDVYLLVLTTSTFILYIKIHTCRRHIVKKFNFYAISLYPPIDI